MKFGQKVKPAAGQIHHAPKLIYKGKARRFSVEAASNLTLPKRGNEFVNANLCLPKDTFQGSGSHGRVERHGHPNCVPAKPHVRASLTQNPETKLLQRSDYIGAGDGARQLHAAASTGSSAKWSVTFFGTSSGSK